MTVLSGLPYARSLALVALLHAVGCFSPSVKPLDPGLVTTLGSCSPTPCVKVSLAGVPRLPTEINATAAEKIQDEIARILYLPVESDSEEASSEHVLEELKARIAEYENIPGALVNWTLNRTAELSVIAGDVVAVEVVNDGYLGGAHGFHEVSLLMFDGQTGAQLTYDDIFRKGTREVFSRVVEAEFRRARNISADQSLLDAGFFIQPGATLPLPQNWSLSKSGLDLHYNPYEVGPYVLGSTRLSIPKQAVVGVLKKRFSVLMSEITP